MSTDDPDSGSRDGGTTDSVPADRLADENVRGEQSLIELLTWVLDTETRARIYLFLRQQSQATSEEIAEATGLYPSTVREALAELNEDGVVTRTKRASSGAGNNPYEYEAIAPGDLVTEIADEVQDELNAVFNLDDLLADRRSPSAPVDITVGDPGHDGDADTEAKADDD